MTDAVAVPEGWDATTLGAIGEYLNGRAFKKSEWSKTGRPIIRIQDLTGSSQNPNYYEGDAQERHTVRQGDFLISWSATLGAYIWSGPEAVLNQHIFKVESKIDRGFHYHLVRNKIAELERNAHGSGMVHVTKGVFDATPVAVPRSREAQRQIADAIDRVDSHQQSASSHVAEASQAIVRLRSAVLAAACSGRLTATWRADHPDAETADAVLAQLRASRKPRRAKEQAVELQLPDLPETYRVATIGECAQLLEYGTSKRCSTDASVGVAVLRMGNIQDGHLDLADLKYAPVDSEITKLTLVSGDLLFNRTNSPELVGKSAIYRSGLPASFASYLIRVRFDERVILPEFANYWINSAWGKAWAQLAKTDGVSQSNINGSKLSLLAVPLPPIDEQAVIVERASAMLSTADELMRRTSLADRAIDQTTQAILAKAFRGELAPVESK